MYALHNLATGALSDDRFDGEPVAPEGFEAVELPGSFVAGLSVWRDGGFYDPPPPPSRMDRLIAMLVTRGVMTQSQADALK